VRSLPTSTSTSVQVLCGTTRGLSSCFTNLDSVQLIILDEAHYCFNDRSERDRLESILARMGRMPRVVCLSSFPLNDEELKYFSVRMCHGKEVCLRLIFYLLNRLLNMFVDLFPFALFSVCVCAGSR
jgi:hypothetical protein